MRRLEREFRNRPALSDHASTIADFLSNSNSISTAAAIEKRFLAFIRWVEQEDLQDESRALTLPVEPEQMLRYAMHLDSHELPLQTIYGYLWAIGFVHRALSYYEPAHHPMVRGFLAELRREHQDTNMFKASALSEEELNRVLDSLHTARRTRGGRLETEHAAIERARIDRALLLTMMQAGLRRAEASRLTWEDIATADDGSGTVLIRSVFPKGSGHKLAVTKNCIEALEDIKLPDADGSTRIFRLSGSQISRRMKTMCAVADIDTSNVSGNTPRATLARMMTERGAPEALIHRQLRLRPSYTHSPYFIEPDAPEALPWLYP